MNELTRTPETVGAEIRGLTAQAKQMTLWFGIEIGRRLCEVKEMIGHGEWLPYLKAQTEFSQSTASRFMTLYREYGAQQQTLFGAESNYPTLNNLSISNALRLLALPENERESFAEEHDVEHMSARELEELIQEKKAAEDERDLYEQKLAEQMGAAERLKKDAETAAQEAEARCRELAETQAQIRALQENIRTLESRPVEVAVQVDEGAVAKAREEEKAAAQKELERLEKKLQKAEKAREQAEATAKAAEDKLETAAADVAKERDGLKLELQEARRKLEMSDVTVACMWWNYEHVRTMLPRVRHGAARSRDGVPVHPARKAAQAVPRGGRLRGIYHAGGLSPATEGERTNAENTKRLDTGRRNQAAGDVGRGKDLQGDGRGAGAHAEGCAAARILHAVTWKGAQKE